MNFDKKNIQKLSRMKAKKDPECGDGDGCANFNGFGFGLTKCLLWGDIYAANIKCEGGFDDCSGDYSDGWTDGFKK